MQTMACLGYVLSMPPCKMAIKSSDGRTCCCQYRSCCGLAERNVRLYHSGAISKERLHELSLDLAQTCPLAAAMNSGCWSTGKICPLVAREA